MRILIVTIGLLCALFAAAAQQPDSSADQPASEKKTKNSEAAAKVAEKQRAEKAQQSNPSAEEKAAPKSGTDKGKEEYDVSEVSPIVTHHQSTLDGADSNRSADSRRAARFLAQTRRRAEHPTGSAQGIIRFHRADCAGNVPQTKFPDERPWVGLRGAPF